MIDPSDRAFPIPAPYGDHAVAYGMDVRTYLAAHAPIGDITVSIGKDNVQMDIESKANRAVEWADALIRRLNRAE